MSGAGFNVRAILRDFYEGKCPHSPGEGLDTPADPLHYRKYECSRCVETIFVRVYALGLGAGRGETKEDERHAG